MTKVVPEIHESESEWKRRILSGLRAIEVRMRDGDAVELPPLLLKIDGWLSELNSTESQKESDPEWRVLGIALLTARGHLSRIWGGAADAVSSYDRALALLDEGHSLPSNDKARLSNLLICRGLATLAGDSVADWTAARGDFERAIEIRERKPERDSLDWWGLAAAWINRGDALEKLKGSENLNEMVRSCDRAIECLERVWFEDPVPLRTRVSLAWMNRGRALARLTREFGNDRISEALQSFRQAVDVLRPGAREGAAEAKRVLAVALCNGCLAGMHLKGKAEESDEDPLREALDWIADTEKEGLEMVTLALTIRLTLCRLLEKLGRVAEIPDLAEEGLENARVTTVQKVLPIEFATLVGELFRCGSEAYLREQPRFLSEYLLDHLDPERGVGRGGLAGLASCHAAAVETLWKGVGQFQKGGFAALGTGEFDQVLELQAEWQHCRARLTELRGIHLEPVPGHARQIDKKIRRPVSETPDDVNYPGIPRS